MKANKAHVVAASANHPRPRTTDRPPSARLLAYSESVRERAGMAGGSSPVARLVRKRSRAGWRDKPVTNDSVRTGFSQRKQRDRAGGFTQPKLRDPESTRGFTLPKLRDPESIRGFTLLELLIVVGIIGLLLVLIAPAFTYIKGGTDVTSAAYTIKGVLDTARTYAMANNTYTWVGFYEENVSNPASPNIDTPAVGRVIMSIVASKDGTMIYDPIILTQQDLTTGLVQVGKLTKIDNLHLWTHTDTPLTPTGSTFNYRPNVASTYCIGNSSPTDSTTPFQYPVGNPAPTAQYTFVKAVQFSPRGEARINNSTINAGTEVFPLQTVAEIALEQTHGAAAPASIPANAVAVQFTGVGGNVTLYRR